MRAKGEIPVRCIPVEGNDLLGLPVCHRRLGALLDDTIAAAVKACALFATYGA